MPKASAIFLQGVVVLIGIGALAFLLLEPHVEGRNVNATLFEIYFTDAFLAYAYVASIAFFVALFQAFKVLGYARQQALFSQPSLKALRTMQYCGMAMIGFVIVGEIFILLPNSDDRPPALVMGLLVALGSLVIAAGAALGQGILRQGMEKQP